MFEVDIPSEMPSERFDRQMSKGWFRSGAVFFRAEMFCLDDAIRGLVHIRLPVEADDPSRSRRRLLRRNRERFRCEIGPAQVDAARVRLYEATKHRFQSFVARDLAPLVHSMIPHVFDTRECCVYDEDRLVAVSYFDVGKESIASQLALYDPEYARHSLGFYTMLEEIEYARSTGIRFFYPGYVVPGVAAFDYKLRIGDVQYLEASGRWRRRARPPVRVRSADRYDRRLVGLERELERLGIPHDRRIYAGFWLGYLPQFGGPAGYASGMVHIRCGSLEPEPVFHLVEYSVEQDVFTLRRVCVDDAIDLLEDYDSTESFSDAYEMRALRYDGLLFESESAREVAQATRDAAGALRRSSD